MGKYLRISSYIRKPFLIYVENLIFFFISVQYVASLPCMLLPDYFILRQAIELVLLKASQPRLWARS